LLLNAAEAIGKKEIKMSVKNFFKAIVRRLTELDTQDRLNLFTWPGKANVQATDANLLIAKAVDSSGQVVVYVAAQPILLVDGYIFNPQSTPHDSQKAGDVIDSALAQRAGVNRMWVVIPDSAPPMEGEKVVRVFERNVHQPVTISERFGCCESRSMTVN
jgi:hypothetical protein